MQNFCLIEEPGELAVGHLLGYLLPNVFPVDPISYQLQVVDAGMGGHCPLQHYPMEVGVPQ